MNLKVPIEILDELAETVISSNGSLDLAAARSSTFTLRSIGLD